MSVNKDLPHVLVLPEDDANRQIANGFHLKVDKIRQMQILAPAGGWRRVLDLFMSDHVDLMDRIRVRTMILLIDCDGRDDRLRDARASIPDRLRNRVFVLGVWTQPEKLRIDLGRSYETIGRRMADDCREGNDTTWGHALLRHNVGEIERLRGHVSPILFGH